MEHDKWEFISGAPAFDCLTDYSKRDEAWMVRLSRTSWGGFIHRFGTHFAVANAGRLGSGRSKIWFESFDSAALFIQLECVSNRERLAYDARVRRNKERRQQYRSNRAKQSA